MSKDPLEMEIEGKQRVCMVIRGVPGYAFGDATSVATTALASMLQAKNSDELYPIWKELNPVIGILTGNFIPSDRKMLTPEERKEYIESSYEELGDKIDENFWTGIS